MTDNIYSGSAGLVEKAKEVVQDVKMKGSEITGQVADMAKDNAAQLRTTARDLAYKAQEKVEETVEQRKSLGADYIGSIAQATQQAAEAFEADLPQAAHYIRLASDQMKTVSDTVRQRDVRQLVGDVQDFARKQPTMFFGGAMILGFAALRFLKSAAPREQAPNASSEREV